MSHQQNGPIKVHLLGESKKAPLLAKITCIGDLLRKGSLEAQEIMVEASSSYSDSELANILGTTTMDIQQIRKALGIKKHQVGTDGKSRYIEKTRNPGKEWPLSERKIFNIIHRSAPLRPGIALEQEKTVSQKHTEPPKKEAPALLIAEFNNLKSSQENQFRQGQIIDQLAACGLIYQRIAQETGRSETHVKSLHKTYKAFPDPQKRSKNFSWSVHKVAAHTDNPHYWLAYAEKELERGHRLKESDLVQIIRGQKKKVPSCMTLEGRFTAPELQSKAQLFLSACAQKTKARIKLQIKKDDAETFRQFNNQKNLLYFLREKQNGSHISFEGDLDRQGVLQLIQVMASQSHTLDAYLEVQA